MMKKAITIALTLGMVLSTSCSNRSAEDIIGEYAGEKAAETAAKIDEKIESNETTKAVKHGVTEATEYAEDAYEYATDKENIENAKTVTMEKKNEAKNFFSYMFDELSKSWEQVKADLQKKPEEFRGQNPTLEDASEFDFYGDYTNPWMIAQGIDTSSQGTALEQFKVLIGKASSQAKETAKKAKEYHDERHPENSEGSSDVSEDILQNNTYTTNALSNALLNIVPQYSGSPYVIVNNNEPFFDDSELTTEYFITLSELDSLGRCGVAYMNIEKSKMPSEPREGIGSIRPSAWNQVKYDILKNDENPQGYLMCRMHLLAYTLSGLNAEERNLISGTFYCNVEGMEKWELDTSYYAKSHENVHILYRVTPVFNENELFARGVLIEARSVETDDFKFCVYCYNVAPGIIIDYATGKSSLAQ